MSVTDACGGYKVIIPRPDSDPYKTNEEKKILMFSPFLPGFDLSNLSSHEFDMSNEVAVKSFSTWS